MSPVLESFFRPHRLYIVAGASTDTSKFGNKIFNWYLHRQLPVIPLNPKSAEVSGIPCAKSISDAVSDNWNTSSLHGQLQPKYLVKPSLSLALPHIAASDNAPLDTAKEYIDSIAISVVTPPKVSAGLVSTISSDPQLKSLVKAIWFQPGTYDGEILDAAKSAGIDTIVAHGDCILVQGQQALSGSQKSWSTKL